MSRVHISRLWSSWLTCPAHDPDYRAAKKDFEMFVESLTPKIAEVDATVPELPVKDLVGLQIFLFFFVAAA